MSNAGQTCVGVERVFVTERGFDRFVDLLRAKAERLRPGAGDAASYGPMTMPGQVEVVRRHVTDALDRGARAVVGGRGSVRAPFVDPIVLVDVPPDAQAMTEETFGPTITVSKVKDADEAVEAANDTRYGLAASVFGGRRAREIAGRLRAGMVSVNSVVAFAGVPALPFGGVGESGFGRIHGPDGLREFSRAKAVTVQRFPLPVPLTSFRRPRQATWMLQRLARLRHGRT
jgi:acyl-CoA reductase-like NAD-dependent aldehyde dehydrogenase